MKKRNAPVFVRVGPNLYRYKSGTYYAFVKKTGRRIHRSLHTNDRKLAERRRSLGFPNAFRSAIVVGSPSQHGIARTLQTLNDNPKITISIFTDEDEALKWVRGQK